MILASSLSRKCGCTGNLAKHDERVGWVLRGARTLAECASYSLILNAMTKNNSPRRETLTICYSRRLQLNCNRCRNHTAAISRASKLVLSNPPGVSKTDGLLVVSHATTSRLSLRGPRRSVTPAARRVSRRDQQRSRPHGSRRFTQCWTSMATTALLSMCWRSRGFLLERVQVLRIVPGSCGPMVGIFGYVG